MSENVPTLHRRTRAHRYGREVCNQRAGGVAVDLSFE